MKQQHVQVVKNNPMGALEIGQVCADNVVTGIGLQGTTSLHYIHLDSTGNRAGWTLIRNPGVFEVKCGDNVNGKSIGMDLECLNGDICISAPNGRIRLSALDIDIMANGPDETRGHIKIEANQDVKVKASGAFDVMADVGYRIYTPNVGKIIANTKLYTISNFITGLTCASASLAGKTDPTTTQEFKTNSQYT
jgi:hypothetical protein